MDKVSHAFVILLPLLLAGAIQCGADGLETDAKAMVERSNQRCDDFFRYRRSLEEADARREKDAQEIKKVRSAHDAQIEAARQEYVRNRKKMIPDPRLEKEADDATKAWIEQNKMAGKRYAQEKAKADAISRRGCRVPEMKEYDLDE
jgi:hypothetical protein